MVLEADLLSLDSLHRSLLSEGWALYIKMCLNWLEKIGWEQNFVQKNI